MRSSKARFGGTWVRGEAARKGEEKRGGAGHDVHDCHRHFLLVPASSRSLVSFFYFTCLSSVPAMQIFFNSLQVFSQALNQARTCWFFLHWYFLFFVFFFLMRVLMLLEHFQ
jgi:hypothetical protein